MAIKILVFLAVLAAVPAGSGLRAAEQRPAPWPDLSEPRAAAFSLGVAVARGDEKAAREIYAGKDKKFFALLDALAALRKSSERFNRVATARFGTNAATLTGGGFEPKLGGVGLTTIVAVTRAERHGRRATVTPKLDAFKTVKIKLKKVGGKWKVTDFPLVHPLLAPLAEKAAAVYKEVADEIERGKYAKAYEVCEALGTKLAADTKTTPEKKSGTPR
jgi:hypothetical protein